MGTPWELFRPSHLFLPQWVSCGLHLLLFQGRANLSDSALHTFAMLRQIRADLQATTTSVPSTALSKVLSIVLLTVLSTTFLTYCLGVVSSFHSWSIVVKHSQDKLCVWAMFPICTYDCAMWRLFVLSADVQPCIVTNSECLQASLC